MQVTEIAPGLWRWSAPHPEWKPSSGGPDGWERDVGCVYCEAGDTILLVDPLLPDEPNERERFWRALDRDVERVGAPNVLLTCHWHVRSSEDVVGRYAGSRLWVSEAAAPELGDTAGRVTDVFRPGQELPGGAVALDAGAGAGEVLYWLPSHGALVPGDVLLGTVDGGLRVCPDDWLDGGFTGDHVRRALRPLLELPIQRVLISHGEPVLERGREALSAAIG
ncbi:MAG TPA: MBL fold metallo-hydrolase [Gaiellaceae bacterium]|nr:MBL fold metallo-hydrolase [Gaiellaceae bacterium]